MTSTSKMVDAVFTVIGRPEVLTDDRFSTLAAGARTATRSGRSS
jgi:hypothetical protein